MNAKSGIYCLKHPFYENTYKIGSSKDIERRLTDGCYNTMFLPENLPTLIGAINVDILNNCLKTIEFEIHYYLTNYRLTNKRELFKIENIEKELLNVIEKLNEKRLEKIFTWKKELDKSFEYERKENKKEELNNINNIKKIKLKSYQLNVIKKIREYYSKYDKGILQCPMGYGKTYIACFYIYKYLPPNNKILIICPQIMICIEFKNILEKLKYKNILLVYAENKYNIEKINENNIIITTYKSCKKLQSIKFDLIIYDEAHHICTNNDGEYKKSLELKGNNKLFMTATPKKCMLKVEDEEEGEYGKIIHKEYISYCIEKGLLCDYQIYSPNVDNYDRIELIKRMKDMYGRKRIILFFNKKNSSKDFCKEMKKNNMNCKHIDGDMKLKEKNEIKNWFESFSEGSTTFSEGHTAFSEGKWGNKKMPCGEENEDVKIISNVGIISEGISICCIDCIIFIDARYSKIQIYQNIGRGLRLYKNKDVCMIVLPQNMVDSINLFTVLFENDTRMVDNWKKKLILEKTNNEKTKELINKFELIQKQFIPFDEKIKICIEYEKLKEKQKKKYITKTSSHNGYKIGYWMSIFMGQHYRDEFTEEEEKKLENIKTYVRRANKYYGRFYKNMRHIIDCEKNGHNFKDFSKDAILECLKNSGKKRSYEIHKQQHEWQIRYYYKRIIAYRKGILSKEKIKLMNEINQFEIDKKKSKVHKELLKR